MSQNTMNLDMSEFQSTLKVKEKNITISAFIQLTSNVHVCFQLG
jgi:hypothetical protein